MDCEMNDHPVTESYRDPSFDINWFRSGVPLTLDGIRLIDSLLEADQYLEAQPQQQERGIAPAIRQLICETACNCQAALHTAWVFEQLPLETPAPIRDAMDASHELVELCIKLDLLREDPVREFLHIYLHVQSPRPAILKQLLQRGKTDDTLAPLIPLILQMIARHWPIPYLVRAESPYASPIKLAANIVGAEHLWPSITEIARRASVEEVPIAMRLLSIGTSHHPADLQQTCAMLLSRAASAGNPEVCIGILREWLHGGLVGRDDPWVITAFEQCLAVLVEFPIHTYRLVRELYIRNTDNPTAESLMVVTQDEWLVRLFESIYSHPYLRDELRLPREERAPWWAVSTTATANQRLWESLLRNVPDHPLLLYPLYNILAPAPAVSQEDSVRTLQANTYHAILFALDGATRNNLEGPDWAVPLLKQFIHLLSPAHHEVMLEEDPSARNRFHTIVLRALRLSDRDVQKAISPEMIDALDVADCATTPERIENLVLRVIHTTNSVQTLQTLSRIPFWNSDMKTMNALLLRYIRLHATEALRQILEEFVMGRPAPLHLGLLKRIVQIVRSDCTLPPKVLTDLLEFLVVRIIKRNPSLAVEWRDVLFDLRNAVFASLMVSEPGHRYLGTTISGEAE